MKRKIALLFIMICICACLTGCQNKHDKIEIRNKTNFVFDDISIDIKDGYFYERHEKFTVDDDTIAVTVYFSNSNSEEEWDSESE